MTNTANKTMLRVSAAGFCFMGISIVLIGIMVRWLDIFRLPWLPYAVASFFWIGLVLGVCLQIVLAVRFGKAKKEGKINMKRIPKTVGVIGFFRGFSAALADLLMGISALAFAIAMIATGGKGVICYFFLAVLVTTFALHCVYNGRVYHSVFSRGVYQASRKPRKSKKNSQKIQEKETGDHEAQ